jgi:hypothetical protein
MNKSKRSPLKGRPLRNPGQSLDEQIQDLVNDYILWPMVFAMFITSFAAWEWLRYYRPQAPSPVVISVAAAVALVFAAYRIYKARPRLRAFKLGRDGEKIVGQFLESLRERGYRVFHDVVAGNFNLDHVLIGPAGVFTVETKTHSKRSGEARVVFDGETIRIDGFEPDRDPIIQARAQASWLRELLAESTGRKFEVKSAIVFPGWFVNYTGPKERTIWVLNPKALPTFLDYERTQLSPEDIQLASFHLSRFVRTTDGSGVKRDISHCSVNCPVGPA